MDEHLQRFADIAEKAQRLANQRGGDYDALSREELCEFMVEYDGALSAAEDAGKVRQSQE